MNGGQGNGENGNTWRGIKKNWGAGKRECRTSGGIGVLQKS